MIAKCIWRVCVCSNSATGRTRLGNGCGMFNLVTQIICALWCLAWRAHKVHAHILECVYSMGVLLNRTLNRIICSITKRPKPVDDAAVHVDKPSQTHSKTHTHLHTLIYLTLKPCSRLRRPRFSVRCVCVCVCSIDVK